MKMILSVRITAYPSFGQAPSAGIPTFRLCDDNAKLKKSSNVQPHVWGSVASTKQ